MLLSSVLFFTLTARIGISATFNYNYMNELTRVKPDTRVNERFIAEKTQLWNPSFAGNSWDLEVFKGKQVIQYYLQRMQNESVDCLCEMKDRIIKKCCKQWSQHDREAYKEALEDLEKEACVIFVEMDNSKPPPTTFSYIKVTNDNNACYSDIGRYEPTNIHIGGCADKKIGALHETMHALGFDHEHQREDRDDFVEIVEANIANDTFKRNFVKKKRHRHFNLSSFPYDYQSIMHYPSTAFSINASSPSIKSRNETVFKTKDIGDKGKLTAYDKQKLLHFHSCFFYEFLTHQRNQEVKYYNKYKCRNNCCKKYIVFSENFESNRSDINATDNWHLSYGPTPSTRFDDIDDYGNISFYMHLGEATEAYNQKYASQSSEDVKYVGYLETTMINLENFRRYFCLKYFFKFWGFGKLNLSIDAVGNKTYNILSVVVNKESEKWTLYNLKNAKTEDYIHIRFTASITNGGNLAIDNILVRECD